MVYLDNSSTTKPCEESVAAINAALTEDWANPSSLYGFGLDAESAVSSARKSVAKRLSCREDEIIFTSCGTESNNTAIFGGAYKNIKRGRKIVTTAVEHPSVAEPISRLESEGFEVVRLAPDSDGKIKERDLENAIDENTALVSIMLVNNETGAIMPVSAAARIIKEKHSPAFLHCDAVQAFGKLPFSAERLGADAISVSGHKIHASKGVGALYIKKGVVLRPFLLGGGQEKGMRSGTESVPLICGMGAAADALGNISENLKKMTELRDYTLKKLQSTGLVTLNSPNDALPYILNVSVLGYRSETLLHFLEKDGIFVSSGSACSKGAGSPVLTAMGLDSKRVDSAIRISFSRFNTMSDADALVNSLNCAAKVLRKAL